MFQQFIIIRNIFEPIKMLTSYFQINGLFFFTKTTVTILQWDSLGYELLLLHNLSFKT